MLWWMHFALDRPAMTGGFGSYTVQWEGRGGMRTQDTHTLGGEQLSIMMHPSLLGASAMIGGLEYRETHERVLLFWQSTQSEGWL